MKKLITLSIMGLMMVPAIAQKYSGSASFGPLVQKDANTRTATSDTLYGNFYNSQATLYTSTNGGFVSGNNGYEDLAKAQQFDVTTAYSVTGVVLWFGHKAYNSLNPASGVTVTLYRMDGNGFNAAGTGNGPGTVERTVFLPVSDIIVNGSMKNIINFASPFNTSTDYAIGIDLINLDPQDTVALYTTTDGGGDMDDHAWEMFDDGDWYTFLASGSWGMDLDYAIFPIVDYSATGIIKNDNSANGISKSRVFPNPAQSISNLSFILDRNYNDVNIEILDANGSLIRKINRGNLMAGSYSQELDMSNYTNGIYTCKVNAGAFTKITRLVVSH